VLPLFLVRGVLTIAVSEPSNLFLIDEIRGLANAQVQIVAASSKDIRRMVTTLPNSKVFVIDDIIEDSDTADVTLIEEAIEDISDVEEIAGQSPIIRLVNYIIFNAVTSRIKIMASMDISERRLVRRICAKCRTKYEPARTIRKALERMGYEFPEFYKGAGWRCCCRYSA
jgi:type II secretory ATPase GspE/PulE/Tfp pilus assembly ATPase PilB-like protein